MGAQEPAERPAIQLTLKALHVQSEENNYLDGQIVVQNLLASPFEISSHGSYMEFLDFHFYDTNGKYLGKCGYGRAFHFHYLADTKEVFKPHEVKSRGFYARLPFAASPMEYFVQASFDYKEIHVRSERHRFAVQAARQSGN